MTSICYFISDLCLQDINKPSMRTKHWLHMQEYQIDSFCPKKNPIKSTPHSQLLQNPKSDYYSNVMMQFKHYFPCKLCYYSSFICTTSSKLQRTSTSLSQPFKHIQSRPFIIHRQDHPLRLVPSKLCFFFSDKWSVLGHFNHLDNKLVIKRPINCLDQIFWTYSVGLVILACLDF